MSSSSVCMRSPDIPADGIARVAEQVLGLPGADPDLRSGRCSAVDREIPIAAREVQRANDQEERRPFVGVVGETYKACAARDAATGDACDPVTAEVAVFPW